jgi:hypothetical protein
METNMPSLQEEMSKVLTEWNQPEPQPTEEPTMTQHVFNITNNVTRATFDYAKAHPGLTATEISKALEPQGYKPASVQSLLASMVRNGLCRKEGYKFFVTAEKYIPLKPTRVLVVKKKAKAVDVATPVVSEWKGPKEKPTITVQSIVENMTMREARELYNELGKYFGA